MKHIEDRLKKIIVFFVLFILVLLGGSIGYMIIEKGSFIDSLYMTAITISTVGYGEVVELGTVGRLFTIFIIFAGVGVIGYGLGAVTIFLVEGELNKYLKGVKMKKEIEKLKEHFIICGAGRTGVKIITEFIKNEKEFVIIEDDEFRLHRLEEEFPDEHLLIVRSQALKEEALMEAGIEKAGTIIAVLKTDAENVFLSLTAKALNENIKVVARAIDSHAKKNLKKAGSDYVVSAIDIAAGRIAATALDPDVVSFLDVVTEVGDEGLKLETVRVESGSDLSHVLLKDARIPQATGVVLIGIKNQEGEMKLNPMSMTLIQEGMEFLVLGNNEQLTKLQQLARGEVKDSNLEKAKINI